MTVLVDSDVLIEVTRGRDEKILYTWRELSRSGEVLCSPVSVAELWAGALAREFEALESLFRALTCTRIDAEVGRQAGAYLLRYRKSHGLAIADALIAAGAVANRADLWTRNHKSYPMKEVEFFQPQGRTH